MTVRPMRPGVFEYYFTPLTAKAQVAAPTLLTILAEDTAAKAREALSRRSHPYGTPTPASPGGPPAMISGTLHDAVGVTTPALRAGGWEVRCGVAAGRVPWYGRTPAHKYAQYLESGDTRNGAAYPFLGPAFDEVVSTGAARVAQRIGRLFG